MKKLIIIALLLIPMQSFAELCGILSTPDDIIKYRDLVREDIVKISDQIIFDRTLEDKITKDSSTKDKVKISATQKAKILRNKYKEALNWLYGFTESMSEWKFWITASIWDVPKEIIRDYEILEDLSLQINEVIKTYSSNWDNLDAGIIKWSDKLTLFDLLKKNEEIKRGFRNVILSEVNVNSKWLVDSYTFDYYWQKVNLFKYSVALKTCKSWSVDFMWEISKLYEKYSNPYEPWDEALALANWKNSAEEEKRLLSEYLTKTWVWENRSEIILWNLDKANWVKWNENFELEDRIVLNRWPEERVKELFNNLKSKYDVLWSLKDEETIVSLDELDNSTKLNNAMNSVTKVISYVYSQNQSKLSVENQNKEIIKQKIINLHSEIEISIEKLTKIEEKAIKVCESQAAWSWICRSLIKR